MKIKWSNDKGSSHVVEILPFNDRHSGIDVSRERDRRTGKWKTVAINWPGCGSVSIEDARLFIAALQSAVEIAENEQASWGTEQVKEE